jgi:hypothetical protein
VEAANLNELCHLCNTIAPLRESHVIPRFVYKWLKDSSGTGFLRFGEEPNRRVQDGFKQKWLCSACEGMFNKWETLFANTIFHSLNRDASLQIHYDDWLLKFCTSVSWRTLNYCIKVLEIDHFPKDLQITAITAHDTWKKFLLGDIRHPGIYEQNFWPFDIISQCNIPNAPPNLHRYMFRTVDIDACFSNKNAFVYSKLGKFVILGFIKKSSQREWGGTKVRLRHGTIKPGICAFPISFFEYIFGKARRCIEIESEISEEQREKIKVSQHSNIERTLSSESLKISLEDIRVFGRKALKRKP